jgi:hypothetical protein
MYSPLCMRPWAWLPTLCALCSVGWAAAEVRGGCWLQPACLGLATESGNLQRPTSSRGMLEIGEYFAAGVFSAAPVGRLLMVVISPYVNPASVIDQCCQRSFADRTAGIPSKQSRHVPMVAQQHGPRNEDGGVRSEKGTA